MATVCGFGCAFVILSFVIGGLSDQGPNHFLIRNKRNVLLPKRCFLQDHVCSEKPYQYCDSGVCLEVVEEKTAAQACIPKCGPSRSRIKLHNNNAAIAVPTGIGNQTVATNRQSVNVTDAIPEDGKNMTSGNITDRTWETNRISSEETNATNAAYPTLGSPSNWKDNPAYCEANFYCQNGGYCSPDYQNKTYERRAPKCICPENWVGDFCQKNCSLKCENNGTCQHVDGYQFCNCLSGYEPPDCHPEVITSLSTSASSLPHLNWFVSVLSVLAVLLVILVTYLIMTKLRWKSMVVTKMFHYFQPYEDDDGRLFDAFISFRSSKKDYSQSEDEKFVYKVLQPVLEKRFGYKICVHYRDFPPGETITNNIMWAVENSRRTILVLSPLYVESEWARLEYQKAQQEMLQLRHKIIPIIYEDISNVNIEDSALNVILSSVTYIKYPTDLDIKDLDRFLSMLQLAMPKKRSVDIKNEA